MIKFIPKRNERSELVHSRMSAGKARFNTSRLAAEREPYERVQGLPWCMIPFIIKRFSFLFIIFTLFFVSCNTETTIFGSWEEDATWIEGPDTFQARIVITFSENGSYESVPYGYASGWVPLTTGAMLGSYSISGNIITIAFSKMLQNSVWNDVSDVGRALYNLNQDILTLTVDMNDDQIYDSSNLFSVIGMPSGGFSDDITYVLGRM